MILTREGLWRNRPKNWNLIFFRVSQQFHSIFVRCFRKKRKINTLQFRFKKREIFDPISLDPQSRKSSNKNFHRPRNCGFFKDFLRLPMFSKIFTGLEFFKMGPLELEVYGIYWIYWTIYNSNFRAIKPGFSKRLFYRVLKFSRRYINASLKGQQNEWVSQPPHFKVTRGPIDVMWDGGGKW